MPMTSPAHVSPGPARPQAFGSELRRLLFAGGRRNTWIENTLLVIGAASLGVSAALHLDLWTAGYSSIHIIGPLFLLQSVAGLALGSLVLSARRVFAALFGVGFLLSTLAGFLISVQVGLFGFQDTWSASFATQTFWDEVIGSCVLLLGAGLIVRAELRRARRPERDLGGQAEREGDIRQAPTLRTARVPQDEGAGDPLAS